MQSRMRWPIMAAAVLGMTSLAGAQAVITNGTIRMGINRQGHLNFGSAPQIVGGSLVGLRYITAAGDYESTADGCACEGWGAGIRTGGSVTSWGGANEAVGGVTNLAVVSFTSTASTATSVVTIGGTGLEITHEYRPSTITPNLYEVNITIRNTGAAAIPDVVYRRVMDWDTSPTQFNENVRISGWGATNLIGAGSNGFLSARPLDLTGGCTIGGVCNGNFETTTGADRGSFFDFSFGALAAGESKTFQTFYGASNTLDGLLAALGAVGAEVYTAAWCAGTGGSGPTACAGKNGPAVFGYGFRGVGGAPPPELPPGPGIVPEPSTYALMATGLLGLAGVARRRNRKA
jgi:hypothetical protein